MLGHIPRKCQGITSSQSNKTVTSSILFARFGILGLFLFSYVKAKLMKYRAETLSELLVHIRIILVEIPQETLNTVFLEWMKRLQKWVQVDDEYVG
jgi:hypothetical protein